MTLRVGIVGCGGISGAHARAYQQAGVPVVACADIVESRARDRGREWGARPYGSLTAMLDEEQLDLVSICTPPVSHGPLAIEALGRGVRVLIEKPSCLSLAEFDAVEDAARRAGLEAWVVLQHRHGSGAKRAKALIEAGRAGTPRVAVCETLWFRPPEYFDLDWRGVWAGEGGGPTLGHAIHQIDLLLHLLGPWRSVTAVASRVERPVQFEDVSVACVTFESGAVASVTTSLLSPKELSRIRIDLSEATLEVNHLYGYADADWTFTPLPDPDKARSLRLDPQRTANDSSDAAPAGDPWAQSGEVDRPSGHVAQIGELVADLEAGRPHPTTLASSRPTMELLTGIYGSALLQRPVSRSELRPGMPFYSDLRGGLHQSEIDARLAPIN